MIEQAKEMIAWAQSGWTEDGTLVNTVISIKEMLERVKDSKPFDPKGYAISTTEWSERFKQIEASLASGLAVNKGIKTVSMQQIFGSNAQGQLSKSPSRHQRSRGSFAEELNASSLNYAQIYPRKTPRSVNKAALKAANERADSKVKNSRVSTAK